MKLFRKKLRFDPIDPLGDGLREAIAKEQASTDRIELTDYIDASELMKQWDEIHATFLSE